MPVALCTLDAMVSAYIEAGENVDKAAEIIGCHPATIYTRFQRAGIQLGPRRRKFTIADEETIVAQYQAGEHQIVLAKKYSCTPSTIGNILLRYGVTKRTPKEFLTRLDPQAIAKTCTRCREVKPITEFAAHGKTTDRRQSQCRPCLAMRKLEIKFNMSEAELRALGTACAGCLATESLVLDHDHRTGGARGWLCSRYNVALGMASDRPDVLRRLADYLESI